MKIPFAVAAAATLFAAFAISFPVVVQAKTVKECTAEWRAAKADFQAKGITEKAYVADCRKTAEKPAETTPPAAPPPPSKTTPTATPARTGANQFTTEVQAKAHCPADLVVWVNLKSKIYHFAGTKNYGNTKQGAYMCEKDATAQGMRASKAEKRPSA